MCDCAWHARSSTFALIKSGTNLNFLKFCSFLWPLGYDQGVSGLLYTVYYSTVYYEWHHRGSVRKIRTRSSAYYCLDTDLPWLVPSRAPTPGRSRTRSLLLMKKTASRAPRWHDTIKVGSPWNEANMTINTNFNVVRDEKIDARVWMRGTVGKWL